MATLKKELKELLDRYGIDPHDKSKLWDCHGVLVLYHKAYEHIQAIEGITFDPPTIIEANTEKKTVALLTVGHMKDRSEWSIGEASPANSKNSYPYAMAEKRAKDRVIGKLVGLAEHVYSEDEADDFKDGAPAPPKEDEDKEAALKALGKEIRTAAMAAKDRPALNNLLKVRGDDLRSIKAASEDLYLWVMTGVNERDKAFAGKAAA